MSILISQIFNISVPLWQWIISQFLMTGLIAANIIGWQQRDKIRLLSFQVGFNWLSAVANAFLFNWVAVAIGAIGGFRQLAFIYVEVRRRRRAAAEAVAGLENNAHSVDLVEESRQAESCTFNKTEVNTAAAASAAKPAANADINIAPEVLKQVKRLSAKRKDFYIGLSFFLIFTAINIVTIYFTMENNYGFVIMAARICVNLALWKGGTHKMRLVAGALWSSVMIVNAVMFFSVMGMVKELITISTVIVFYARLYAARKRAAEIERSQKAHK